MSKKYVVVVSDMVQVPIEGKLNDENGTAKPFKFSLTCRRRSATEIREALDAATFSAQDFMKGVTTGWKGQRLVMEEDGQTPAEFCEESFDALLDVSGMAMFCFNAFGKAAGVTAKN
jgi:hypothetical protein